ncbi:MAG: hypothetical protein ACT4P5_13115, partial [Armatimonadota bacterium]
MAAESSDWSRWATAESAFLDAMWRFDQNFAGGMADQGDNQNGKGDFFTDLSCILLERCSGKTLNARPPAPGRIFRNHALDAAYPSSGVVEVLIETKVSGAPRTGRNPSQSLTVSLAGSAMNYGSSRILDPFSNRRYNHLKGTVRTKSTHWR